MDIAIRAAARPGQRRLVHLCAILAGVAAGLVIGLAARVPGRIPADARVVTVTPVFDFDSGPSRGEPDDAFTITDPATVAKIAAIIDGLRQLQDGSYSCPAGAGSAMMLTSMQLTLRTAPGGPVIATVGADYVGCQFVWVTVARGPSGRSMRTSAPGGRCSSRSWPSRASAGRTRPASRCDPPGPAQLPPRPRGLLITAAVAHCFNKRSPHMPSASWRPRARSGDSSRR